ncbi:Uncharacterized protein PBTT_01137 [Plasmodiophora brassicae]|uniref:Uncharacterized protein n=1 Tax=Plasmodiophora brassicae TaxID=37360 RepID=A0A0G4IZ95_PLABS|nr:hypothetical protein PBRA_001654 [Plasmodiophora brassicae]SPQ93907.1 unnamed protein product [Plasmodiophora brassicae]
MYGHLFLIAVVLVTLAPALPVGSQDASNEAALYNDITVNYLMTLSKSIVEKLQYRFTVETTDIMYRLVKITKTRFKWSYDAAESSLKGGKDFKCQWQVHLEKVLKATEKRLDAIVGENPWNGHRLFDTSKAAMEEEVLSEHCPLLAAELAKLQTLDPMMAQGSAGINHGRQEINLVQEAIDKLNRGRHVYLEEAAKSTGLSLRNLYETGRRSDPLSSSRRTDTEAARECADIYIEATLHAWTEMPVPPIALSDIVIEYDEISRVPAGGSPTSGTSSGATKSTSDSVEEMLMPQSSSATDSQPGTRVNAHKTAAKRSSAATSVSITLSVPTVTLILIAIAA